MFANTQTVSVNGTGAQLPRIAFGDRRGTFENVAAGLRLTISHTLGKRQRKVVRIDHSKTVTDPLLAGVNRAVSASVYSTVDMPNVGYSPSEIDDLLESLAIFLSVPENRAQIANGES